MAGATPEEVTSFHRLPPTPAMNFYYVALSTVHFGFFIQK